MKLFKHPVIVILLLFLSPLTLLAQISEDSVQQTEEVVIEVSRLKSFTTGNKIQHIDAATLQNFNSLSLADVLSQHSQVFVKSYGPANIASVSLRGTSASHTAVMWNGFNIQGPALGQADFSLIPAYFLEDVQVQYGGAGALFGSGAIGGTIHLNNTASFDKGISLALSGIAGSFGKWYQAGKFTISKKKFVSTFKFFNNFAKNNYPFINGDRQRVRQFNAEEREWGLMQENYLRLGDNQQLSLNVWIQRNDRQSSASAASLQNDSYRFSSEWRRVGEMASHYVRTAYFNEPMIYTDPVSSTDSRTHFQTSVTEAESKIYIAKNHSLNTGINYTFNTATSAGYAGRKTQSRGSAFAAYRIQNNAGSWKGTVSAREELYNDRLIPFTPAAGFEGRLLKGITLNGNMSRNYRVPTFNDRYWVPGGDPDIQPESGWSEELGLSHAFKGKTTFSHANVTVYNSNLRDWIIWLPQGSYWAAQNIQQVWARGIEITWKTEKAFSDKLRLKTSLMYSYTLSTNQKARSANDEGIGKQLIYVPIYACQGNVTLSYKTMYLDYVHTYTGNRFTANDNSQYLPGYMLGHLVFNQSFYMNKSARVDLNIRVNNLWNQSYEVMQGRPMPLRSYQLGLTLFYHQPKTKL